MSKSIREVIYSKMAEKGRVVTLPKDSPLRDIFNIPYKEAEAEVESTETKED